MGRAEVIAGGAGRYLHWGVLQISVTNLVIIGLMLALFAAALFLPFPGHDHRQEPGE
jgi:hypothetical protein